MAKRNKRNQPISIACTNCDVSSDFGIALEEAVKRGWKEISATGLKYHEDDDDDDDRIHMWPYTSHEGTCKDCELEVTSEWYGPLKTFRAEEPSGQLFD